MKAMQRFIAYLIVVITLYAGTVYLTKIKFYKTQQELQQTKRTINGVYNRLTELMNSSISQILKLPQEDTIKTILKSRASFFISQSDPFNNLVENDQFENALYTMNQKSALFFEIVNFAWEFVPSLKNTSSLNKILEEIGDLELTIDSLLTKAEKLHKNEELYRKIYHFLWPFTSLNRAKMNKPATASQKISARKAPANSNSLLFLTLNLSAFATASL
jgi:hypothetical protein